LTHVHKQYGPAFLLEPTKLERIVNTIHERLTDHSGVAVHDVFDVFLSGNHHEELTSIADVLALDNSRKRRIKRLVIRSSATFPDSLRPDHEVQVDFAGPKPGDTSGNAKVIGIDVRSDEIGWASRTLSEVEEQVERTWQRHARPLFALLGLFTAVLILLASQFVSLVPGNTSWYFGSADRDRIRAMLAQHDVLTEEDLREVSTMQLSNLADFHRLPGSKEDKQKVPSRILALPLSVVVVLVLILLTTGYPHAVFLWGDEVARYADIVQRRRVIWTMIVGVTTIGVLSRIFSEALTSWLARL
jgi:hypothetical protein